MPDESSSPAAVILRSEDNIAVACRDIRPGEKIPTMDVDIEAAAKIPLGHKLAIGDIPEGAEIRKYGQVIGFASEAILRPRS